VLTKQKTKTYDFVASYVVGQGQYAEDQQKVLFFKTHGWSKAMSGENFCFFTFYWRK
jgi:hypothetical protein